MRKLKIVKHYTSLCKQKVQVYLSYHNYTFSKQWKENMNLGEEKPYSKRNRKIKRNTQNVKQHKMRKTDAETAINM